MKEVDIAIIGAGPAGMAAANEAARHSASVLLLDEQSTPGGQIYRHLKVNSGGNDHSRQTELMRILGSDYASGSVLIDHLSRNHGAVEYLPNAVVWQLSTQGTVTYSIKPPRQIGTHSKAGSSQVNAKHIVVANGALERPVPLPGWTLPGVMTVGAAQILLKSSALVPDKAVLVGSGPLLYLFAQQLINAGTPPAALVETQTRANYLRAVKHLPAALKGWRTLAKGLSMLRDIRAAGVPRYTAAHNIRIEGQQSVSHLTFNQGLHTRQLECGLVFLHQGVVPNTQISRALGLPHHWQPVQRCFTPMLSAFVKSTHDNISFAGDGAGILGAAAAAATGQLAALNAVSQIGRLDEITARKLAEPVLKSLCKERAPRAFLDAMYSPPREILQPANDVTVCRCEEVTAGDIRSFAAQGCVGPNQTKAFGRCGMGHCQGRYCALTVTELLSAEHALPQSEVGSYRIRSPVKPVTLSELAALSDDNTL